jgi:hypothetical protein
MKLAALKYPEVQETVQIINSTLAERYAEEHPVSIDLDHYVQRPHLKITSFEPVEFDYYGLLINRGPKLRGNLVLRTIIARPDYDTSGPLVYVGVEDRDTPDTGHGIRLRSTHHTYMNWLFTTLHLPALFVD